MNPKHIGLVPPTLRGRILVCFAHQFVSGPLAGIIHPDKLIFFTRESACRWLRGIRRNSRLGSLEYRLRNVQVSTLASPQPAMFC